jgi:hypothetical protein
MNSNALCSQVQQNHLQKTNVTVCSFSVHAPPPFFFAFLEVLDFQQHGISGVECITVIK